MSLGSVPLCMALQCRDKAGGPFVANLMKLDDTASADICLICDGGAKGILDRPINECRTWRPGDDDTEAASSDVT